MPRRTEPLRPLRESAAMAFASACTMRRAYSISSSPSRRQPRAAALLDEQRAAELLFKAANVHRNRRLGLVDPLGRAGERAEIDDGEEGAELVGVEHAINLYLSLITLQTFVGPINSPGA